MITKELFREKTKDGIFSEEEISQVEQALDALRNMKHLAPAGRKVKGTFAVLVKNFFAGYNAPGIWKQITESVLILFALAGTILLGYSGKLEPMIVTALIAMIVGFIFGKMR